MNCCIKDVFHFTIIDDSFFVSCSYSFIANFARCSLACFSLRFTFGVFCRIFGFKVKFFVSRKYDSSCWWNRSWYSFYSEDLYGGRFEDFVDFDNLGVFCRYLLMMPQLRIARDKKQVIASLTWCCSCLILFWT